MRHGEYFQTGPPAGPRRAEGRQGGWEGGRQGPLEGQEGRQGGRASCRAGKGGRETGRRGREGRQGGRAPSSAGPRREAGRQGGGGPCRAEKQGSKEAVACPVACGPDLAEGKAVVPVQQHTASTPSISAGSWRASLRSAATTWWCRRAGRHAGSEATHTRQPLGPTRQAGRQVGWQKGWPASWLECLPLADHHSLTGWSGKPHFGTPPVPCSLSACACRAQG